MDRRDRRNESAPFKTMPSKSKALRIKHTEAYQARHLAAGLCRMCPRAQDPGCQLCAQHRAIQNVNNKAWRIRKPGYRSRADLKAARQAKAADFTVSTLKNATPEVEAWIREHKDLFYDKADFALWNAAPLEESYEVRDLSAALDPDFGADPEI